MKRIFAAGAVIVLSSSMGSGGLAASKEQAPSLAAADAGEVQAAEYYRQKDHCAVGVQYGEKPVPMGPITGNPEKDTYAYPIERTDTRCEPRITASDTKPAPQPALQKDASQAR